MITWIKRRWQDFQWWLLDTPLKCLYCERWKLNRLRHDECATCHEIGEDSYRYACNTGQFDHL